MKERVRFAPSPTGNLHIGGLKTALINYIMAKKTEGEFIIRIEDTDSKRKKTEALNYIFQSLSWMNIEENESVRFEGEYGPYLQSERKKIYKNHIEKLLKEKKVYKAYDTNEELEAIKKIDPYFKYNTKTRGELKNDVNPEFINNDRNYVIRLKNDENNSIVIHDELKGIIEFNDSELEDKILVKEDGMPTYHFANVIDDHLMKITTVIRGEEWISSMPIHWKLYDLFEWKKPKFFHIPLILNPSGKGKLSKRNSDKTDVSVHVLDYKEKGYLPLALFNYLINPLEENIKNEETIIKDYNIIKQNKNSFKFDLARLNFLNKKLIQQLSTEDFLNELKKNNSKKTELYSDYVLENVINLVKFKLTLVNDFFLETEFFIQEPRKLNIKKIQKIQKLSEKTSDILILIKDKGVNDLKQHLENLSEEKGIKPFEYFKILRVAIIGDLKGPDLFESLHLMKKNVILKRIEYLKNIL